MEPSHVPHVLMIPFPLQGHIKPMLTLAQLFCRAGLRVTFLNSDHNHRRLTSIAAFCRRFPRLLHFASIPDGLPADHPRSGLLSKDLFFSTRLTKPLFRDFLVSQMTDGHFLPPPTCVVADAIVSYAVDVAEEFGIPVIAFPTYSACCLWIYLHVGRLIDEGEIPFETLEGGDEDMDRPVTSIPGLETLIRRRDLPNICRFKESNHPVLRFFLSETLSMMSRSSSSPAVILNTFDDLESPILSRLRTLFPKIYTLGPLHALLSSQTAGVDESLPPPHGDLHEPDPSCMKWLDSQRPRSVVYVSFGSLIVLTRDQMLEFWHGLVSSGERFLWALRRDAVAGGFPVELEEEGTWRERGCVVGWAPQEEVLVHWAVGGFLTHAGWNSTLEAAMAGVPMIGWPQLADQHVNSRCVSDTWRIGIDMKDTCDRSTVEKMVRDLLGDKQQEMAKSTAEIARKAGDCLTEGGSSARNLGMLVEDIRAMHLAPK